MLILVFVETKANHNYAPIQFKNTHYAAQS
jgi:hypothetical protein